MRTRARIACSIITALAVGGLTDRAYAAICQGVDPWAATTIYKPGDKLTYKNHLWEAKIDIWNAAPDQCPTCERYADLGACEAGPNQPPTATISSPAAGAMLKPGQTVTVKA